MKEDSGERKDLSGKAGRLYAQDLRGLTTKVLGIRLKE